MLLGVWGLLLLCLLVRLALGIWRWLFLDWGLRCCCGFFVRLR